MNAKKLFALILAIVMIATLFTACSSDKKKDDDSGNSSKPSSNPGASDSGGIIDDEPVEINYWAWDTGVAGQNTRGAEVEALINEISEREIGVHVNFTWVTASDFGTQLTLAIANNESIDLCDYYAVGGSAFSKLYAAGSLSDITELVAENAPELIELCGEDVLSGTTIDGKLYGIPTYRILNSDCFIIMRTDILEDIGMVEAAENMETWADFEEIMQAVKDSEYAGYAIGGGNAGKGIMNNNGFIYCGNKISDSYAFDPLGEIYFAIATDQNGNVISQVEMEESQECFKMIKSWYDNGYLYPDSAFTTTGARELIATDTYFSTINTSEYGVEANWGGTTGYPITAYTIQKGLLNTNNCQKFGMFVPSTATEPEAAVRFMNLLYTNAEMMNLMCWGIEGETYQVIDGVAQYVGDVDAAGSGYHRSDYSVGNQFLCVPWAPNGADFRDLGEAYFKEAPGSIYLGLTVDTSAYESLVAAQAAVSEEFHGMMVGGLYSEAVYNEYIEKLYAADLEGWIDLHQAAVDEFMK